MNKDIEIKMGKNIKTRNVFRLLKNFFFPPRCVFCDRTLEINDIQGFCDECVQKIEFCRDKTCCEKCGKPVVSYGEKKRCYFCMNTAPLYFHKIVSVCEYKGEVRRSIGRFKGAMLQNYAPVYAELLKGSFYECYGNIAFDFMCCAPSHKEKKIKQGFDNVELICKKLAPKIGIPLRKDVLKKIRKTQKQTELGYRQRQENLKNSMKVSKPEQVAGKTVLLVDDVCTTRATAIECSRALIQGGAKRVCVLTLATTVKENN